MRDNYETLKALNTCVIGISVDTPEKCLEFQEKLNLPFPLLSDERRLVIDEYRASDTAEKDGKIIAKSVNVIFKKGGEIVYRHVSDWKYRTPFEDLTAILEDLQ